MIGALLGALAISNVIVLSPAPIEIRLLGCLALLVVLPGWLSMRLLLTSSESTGSRSLTEEALLTLGLGFCAAMLLGMLLTVLALVGLTRPVASWHVTLVADAAVLVLLSLAVRTETRLDIRLARPDWSVLTIACIAGMLRLSDLGWSEFQGDEARILLRAMAAIQGVPDALLAHRKVPGEILVTLPFFGQLGAITELTGRLPFALSATAAIVAFYMLARELFDSRVALVAGLLMAVNGYSVAFGRILQYDSLAFLLGTLGLICCVRFGRGEQPATALALAGSVLLCCAGLIALGSMFFVFPATFFVGTRIIRLERNRTRLLALWLWPGVLATLLVLLVLAVEVIGHRDGGVLSYLGPRLGGTRPYWNWGEFLTSANHYLSTPYLALTLGCGILSVLAILAQRLRGGSGRLALFAVALTLLAAAGSWTRLPAVALTGSLIALAVVLTADSVSLARRAAIAWAVGPLIVHAFLIRVPGTHWREAFPGLVLLTATLLVTHIPAGPLRRLASGAGVVFIVALTHFSWVTLVQRWPEYQMTYPDQRHWLDWTNATGRAIGGVFGASHRHGWKTLAMLQDQGHIPTSFTTNESPAISAWYLRRPQGCPTPPEVILRVQKSPQDRNLLVPVPLPPGYINAGSLVLQGRGTVTLQVDPASPTRFGTTQAGAFDDQFDRGSTSPWRPVEYFYQADLGFAVSRGGCATHLP